MSKSQKPSRNPRVSEAEKTYGYKMVEVHRSLLSLDSVKLNDGTKVKPSELTRDQAGQLSNASCRAILTHADLKGKGKRLDALADGKSLDDPTIDYPTTRRTLSDAIWFNDEGILEAFFHSQLNFNKGPTEFKKILRFSPTVAKDIIQIERPAFEVLQAIVEYLNKTHSTSFENVMRNLRETGILVTIKHDDRRFEMPQSVLAKFEV